MEFKLETGPDLVLIEPDDVERKSEDSVIAMSDQEKKNREKEQDRGKIKHIGQNVSFWQVDDYVSFYRNAATPVKDGGKEYLTIHKGHILVRFIEITE
jgi:co-chaperonin GroES (HSP10)